MTISHRQQPPRLQRTGARLRAALYAVATVTTVGFAGCGSSSSDEEPFADYRGVWTVDTDQSTLSCPQSMEIGTDGMMPFSPWTASPLPNVKTGTVTLEAGVLADLVQTQGVCPFNFDVMTKTATATVLNPDPYSGQPPACIIPVTFVGGNTFVPAPLLSQFIGETSRVTLTPGVGQLSFQLLEPQKGQAPTAQILGSANAQPVLEDIDRVLVTLPPCTFSARVKLHKIAKP
jgi:hypothetical protein